jgi:hypothetical protein
MPMSLGNVYTMGSQTKNVLDQNFVAIFGSPVFSFQLPRKKTQKQGGEWEGEKKSWKKVEVGW